MLSSFLRKCVAYCSIDTCTMDWLTFSLPDKQQRFNLAFAGHWHVNSTCHAVQNGEDGWSNLIRQYTCQCMTTYRMCVDSVADWPFGISKCVVSYSVV